MNQTDHDDHDLTQAFQELKAAETASASPFSTPESRRGHSRLGYTAYALAMASVVVAFLSLELPRRSEVGPETIAFDQFPEIISRELYASAATTWQGPTSFLINTELPTLTELDL